MKKIINILVALASIFFFLVFVYALCIRDGVILYNKELPLIGIQEIVKNKNKIYIGLSDFNRVQIYDLNGKYVDYIPTSNYHKDFNFKVDTVNNVDIKLIYLRKMEKNSFAFNDDVFVIKRRYPAHIEIESKNGKGIFIKNSLPFLLFGSHILSLVMSIVCMTCFYLINSSVIHKILDNNKVNKFNSCKNIFREIFFNEESPAGPRVSK